jgi:hypothetical protein
MEIAGEWYRGDDGTTRPFILVNVLGENNVLASDRFLIDTGADRSVLSEALLDELKLPVREPPTEERLVGVGGPNRFVLVNTVLIFTTNDGGTARFRGEFAAFLDSSAIDSCVLGRDVLDHLDLILSRRRNEVRLLGTNHTYQVLRQG